MSTRRLFLQLGAMAGTGAVIRWQLDPKSGVLFSASRALASHTADQPPLPGASVRQFVTPLPTFVGGRVTAASFTASMREFQQKVLPDSMYAGLARPFSNGTYLWGYEVDSSALVWPATTIVAQRGRTTTVKWQNDIPFSIRSNLQKYLTLDQTVHWADPLHQMGSTDPYAGPPAMVVHLHGAEDSSSFDGAAEAWFTPNGLHGKGYSTLSRTDANAAIYQYPNQQQATTLWFHDHALGSTRVKVLSGLTGMYFIRDQFDTGRSDNPLRLPADGQEIELVIQDRQFDTNLQLLISRRL
jgi:spore coat protein A